MPMPVVRGWFLSFPDRVLSLCRPLGDHAGRSWDTASHPRARGASTASTTLLADSRNGVRGGLLPWAPLVAGSAASLAANVAVAEPTVPGRVFAASGPRPLKAGLREVR